MPCVLVWIGSLVRSGAVVRDHAPLKAHTCRAWWCTKHLCLRGV